MKPKQGTLWPSRRGGWPAELAEAYARETGGVMSPGRIGRALAPLLRAWRTRPPGPIAGYEDPLDILKVAFGEWMRSPLRKFGPELIAREPEEFLPRWKI